MPSLTILFFRGRRCPSQTLRRKKKPKKERGSGNCWSPFIIGSPSVGFTEPLGVWDKFLISQGVRGNTRYIEIGRQPRRTALKVAKHRNPLKQALEYKSLLDAGEVDSQTEIARLCRTPRSTISAYLRLLALDDKVKAQVLAIDDDDDRLAGLSESVLRRLIGHEAKEQRRRFRDLVAGR